MRLSNITLSQHQGKEHRLYFCSAFRSHSKVFNNWFPYFCALSSILLKRKTAEKMECPMGSSQKFPRRPRDASEENTREKPDEKKGAAIISLTLPVTSLPIMSFPVNESVRTIR
jgi:hypothetical protein